MRYPHAVRCITSNFIPWGPMCSAPNALVCVPGRQRATRTDALSTKMARTTSDPPSRRKGAAFCRLPVCVVGPCDPHRLLRRAYLRSKLAGTNRILADKPSQGDGPRLGQDRSWPIEALGKPRRSRVRENGAAVGRACSFGTQQRARPPVEPSRHQIQCLLPRSPSAIAPHAVPTGSACLTSSRTPVASAISGLLTRASYRRAAITKRWWLTAARPPRLVPGRPFGLLCLPLPQALSESRPDLVDKFLLCSTGPRAGSAP